MCNVVFDLDHRVIRRFVGLKPPPQTLINGYVIKANQNNHGIRVQTTSNTN